MRVKLKRAGFTLDVDFRVGAPITGIFGPSGAGKSTLISLIAGLSRPDRGLVSLDDTTLFDDARRINVPAHRRRVGVVFQEHRLFPHRSVKGNLRYAHPRDDPEFRRIVELLELGPLLDRRIHELSGGERQRVALGRAVLAPARLLLLDEPLASLDRRLKLQILPYLRRLRDEARVPMLYVSHDLSEILLLTDRLLVLDSGSLVGHGRYPDVLHEKAVLPVVHGRGMTNVLRARVRSVSPDDGVCTLALVAGGDDPGPGPCILVAPLGAAMPAADGCVAISIEPREIALASAPVAAVSIQNQIRGTVRRCNDHGQSCLVEVDVGASTPIIAEVSRRSAASLRLGPGCPIVCLIKAHAIRSLPAEP